MKGLKERFDIEEVNDEFIGEVLPNAEELDLTVNQIKVLAVLKYISRIDKKDKDGYFYVENDYIRKVCKIGSKSTLNNAFGVLVESGYIDRKSSKIVGKASKYRVHLCTPQVYTGEVTDNQVVTENKNDKCTPNCTSNCTIDTDIDIESDSESHKDSESDIYNIINNIIKENNNNLINIIEEKENNIINIIKEKEKSSIKNNNKKEKDTLMEDRLQQQINQLNELFTSRLNNAAKQFKAMMKEIKELQQEVAELKKENKTSTAFCGDAVEDVKEVKKEQTPTVGERKDKEQIRTIDVEVKLSPTEEGINVEGIVEYFKEKFKDPQEAREMENALLGKCKEARLSYYNCCELEHRLSKYIKSLELSMDKEEVKEPIKEEVKETIPTVQVEVAQVPIEEELKELPQEAIKEADEVIVSRKEDKATEEKESTFVGMFQEVKGDCVVGEEKLRYQNLKTKAYYSSLKEAKASNVNPMFLYDNEVKRCVFSYQ